MTSSSSRITASYETRNFANDTYMLQLEIYEEGRWMPYDSLSLSVSHLGAYICTPAGYTSDPDGAKAYARHIWAKDLG